MKKEQPNQIPDLRHELREMRRELGLLKTAFSSLNQPPVYYSTARAAALLSISRQTLFNRAAQGLISPMRVGRKVGWPKEELERLDARTKKQEPGLSRSTK